MGLSQIGVRLMQEEEHYLLSMAKDFAGQDERYTATLLKKNLSRYSRTVFCHLRLKKAQVLVARGL
jgi:hypothetical protein